MPDIDDFQRSLAGAFLRLADDLPGTVDAAAVAHRVALEHPRRREHVLGWRPAALPRLAWSLLLVAAVVPAMVGGMLVAGYLSAPSPVPVAPSPTANPDQPLVDDLAAVWSGPYDAAKVAALYTPDAVLHDNSANETSTGLAAIQAKVQKYAALKFKVANKSAPIRQGNFVAIFCRFGQDTARYPALVVYELRDGKVVNQWVYPAP